MYELVELKGNDVFTNSKMIAEGTGNQHKNVKIEGILRNLELYAFQMRKVLAEDPWNFFILMKSRQLLLLRF